MMFSRRRFICGATASTLVLPSFMGMLSAKASAASDTILVILNMQGGNDGYGMIMPIAQATYGQYQTLRPSFLPPETSIESAGTAFDSKYSTPASQATQYSFNTSMGLLKGGDPASNLRALYGQGKVALITGVGLPPSAPARTDHFTGALYNSTGQLTGDPVPGWGSKIAAKLGNQKMSIVGLNGVGTVIGNAGTPVLAVGDLSGYGYTTWHDGGGPVTQPGSPAYALNALGASPGTGSMSEYVRNLGDDALSFITQVHAYGQQIPASDYRTTFYDPSNGSLQDSPFKDQLKQAARLILAGSPGRIYYGSIANLDTHSNQVPVQKHFMAQLSESIGEFMSYLKAHGKGENVVVMTTSDFGRRPYENGNQGTDHGTSTVSLVVGDRVNGGVYGQYPTFTKASLDSGGNFVVAVDFRALLSQVVANFGADPHDFFPEYGANDADASIYEYSQHAVSGLFKG